MPDTEVIVVAHPSPVFVDSTGRRSRMLRRIAYGFGALCMVYGGLVSVSLAGGPVSSSAVLPLPDLADSDDEQDLVVARPSPIPEPVNARTSAPPILEVLPRRGLPVTQPRQTRAVTPRSTTSARVARTPTPGPTKKPAATTPKPVESTTTKPTTPTTTPTSEPTPPLPVPPAPPAPTAGSGGQGGGSGQGDSEQDNGGQDGSGGQGGGSANEQPATTAPEAPARQEPVAPAPPAVTSPVKVSVTAAGKPAVTVRIGAAVSGNADAEPAEEPEPDDRTAA